MNLKSEENVMAHKVSMKSGLEDRNNRPNRGELSEHPTVSMKSGLEDRNNQ